MQTASSPLHALDDARIGVAHWSLLAVVGIGLFVDSFDIFVASSIQSALLHEGFADLDALRNFAAATALGLALGALVGGFMGDRLGRRVTILVGALFVTVGSLASFAAPTVTALTAARSFTALGLGIENVLAYGILIEFLPARARGTWMTALAFLATCAAPLSLLVSYYVAPAPGGWRLLFGIVAALSAATLALRFSLPESARWLALRGRHREAAAVIMRFAPHAAPQPVPESEGSPSTTSSSALFRGDLIRRLAVATSLNIALVSATFGFLSWLPTFFAAEGRTLSSALFKSAIITTGAPLGVLIGLIAADRLERKWTTVAAALATSVMGVAYGLAPPTWMLPLGFSVAVAIYAFGALGVTAYMPELFATSIRMRAVGLAISAGRLTAVIVPATTLFIFERSGQAGVVGILATILALVAVAVACFGVRTKSRHLDTI